MEEVEPRKVKSRARYIFAFLIGTILFAFGFMIVYSISYFEYQRVSNLQSNTAYNIFEDKLSYSFFNESICTNISLEKISNDLGFQGAVINDLENKFGKNDERVLDRKKFYSIVLLEHFEFVKLLNEKCNSNISTILFFYSNIPSESERSGGVGRLLDIIGSKNPGKIMVYSFDVNLNSDMIKKIKEKYNITGSPIVVINEKNKVVNPQGIREIEKWLK